MAPWHIVNFAWLPPHQTIPSFASLFILFFSGFGKRLKDQVAQCVGGDMLDRVIYIAQGWQLKSAVPTAFLLFFPAWMTVPGVSADVRGWVMVIVLFLGLIFVVFPVMTKSIDTITAPYEPAIQGWWRPKLRKVWPGISDGAIYRYCLGIPHMILIIAHWRLSS